MYLTDYALQYKAGLFGKGRDSFPRSCEFKSHWCNLDETFSHLFVVKIVKVFDKTKIN